MRLTRAIALAGAAVCAGVGATCDDGTDDPAAGDGREAAVYELVLGWVLDGEPATADDAERTVFVASRHEQAIDVEVQAHLVEAFDGQVVIRFVDDRSEAVGDDDRRPVRDDGVLVGLGAVPSDGDRVEVYVDRYRSEDDVAAWDVTARRAGDVWELAGDPITADVRPVPDGD